MNNKIIKFGDIKELSEAFDILYKAVSITLGPGGKLVMVNPLYGQPFVTKDGVTVSENIGFDDAVKNTVVDIIKQISKKTVIDSGDGTTTSVVIGHSLLHYYLDHDLNKYPIRKFKLVLDKFVSDIITELKESSVPLTIDDVYNIAYTSSNGDEEVSKIIEEVFKKVGLSGSISIENSRSDKTDYIIKSGYQINKGFIDPSFINDTKTGECIQENAKVLVINKAIVDFNELVPAMKIVLDHKNPDPLLIIALGFSPAVISGLVVNKGSGYNICAIMAPYLGQRRIDTLYDIASVVGANKVLNDSSELLDHKEILNNLGTIKKVVVSKDYSTFFDSENNKVKLDRISSLKHSLKEINVNYDIDQIKERLNKLSGGVATIRVGGSTEAEQKELSDRIEDAVCAVRAAVSDGTVVGGGYALKNLKCLMNDNKDNLDQDISSLLYNACCAPNEKILENSELNNPDVLLPGTGINAYDGEIVDLRKEGILDPVKVTISALKNAVSIFKLLISTGAIVADTKASGIGL